MIKAAQLLGLRGLPALPVLAAAVPFLSFSTTPALMWAWALVWGAALGVHESTMRAAVTDISSRRTAAVAAMAPSSPCTA